MAAIPVFVGCGSNSVNATEAIKFGLDQLNEHQKVTVAQISSFYLTEPQEYKEQPWFTNCVAKLGVAQDLSAEELLANLLAIEAKVGRRRDPSLPRFGPRVLDLDLLLFGEAILDTPSCTVPHPRMFKRAFVLVPLLEIAPDLLIKGKPIHAYLKNFTYSIEGQKIYQA